MFDVKGLVSFLLDKGPPIVVAGVRAALVVGIPAFIGVVTTQLDALSWGEYAPIGAALSAGLRWLGEGIRDQLKKGDE